MRPDDPWNYGVIGDAAIELGRYDEAFAAFDRMAFAQAHGRGVCANRVRARAAGQPGRRVTAMRMAIEATGPQDPEGIAWAWSQLGALHLQQGDIDEASAALRPGALRVSAASVRAWQGRHESPSRGRFRRGSGDLPRTARAGADAGTGRARGRPAPASRRCGGRSGRVGRGRTPGTRRLEGRVAAAGGAGAPAGRARSAAAGSRCAWRVRRPGRDDIFTNDALAWALYRTGEFDQAWAASERARAHGHARPSHPVSRRGDCRGTRGRDDGARLRHARARRPSGVRPDCGAGGEGVAGGIVGDALTTQSRGARARRRGSVESGQTPRRPSGALRALRDCVSRPFRSPRIARNAGSSVS